MDTPINRGEFIQFQERMKSENEKLADADERQNERLKHLEDSVERLWELAGTIKELAVNMKNMVKEQERQGEQLKSISAIAGEIGRLNSLSEKQRELEKRISDIERKPAKRWEGIKEKFISGLVGAAAATVFGGLVWLITQAAA